MFKVFVYLCTEKQLITLNEVRYEIKIITYFDAHFCSV